VSEEKDKPELGDPELGKPGLGTPASEKPPFDEQALARLLEAAYVLQEHNRRLQEMELRIPPRPELTEPEVPAPPAPLVEGTSKPAHEADYTYTLGQIVDLQHQIQVRHLEFADVTALIASRVTEIAQADGCAIGILENKKVLYRASSGETGLPVGTAVAMEKALSVATLRTGQVVRCPDVNTEFLLDADECRRRGIQSLIAVPIYHDGGIAGGLELYYSRPQGFGEQDVHSCQLMAGLVTEALARDEELTWKKSLATERAVMMEALEKMRPGMAAGHANTSAVAPNALVCVNCGNALMPEEQFCGDCGTPRRTETPKPLPPPVDPYPAQLRQPDIDADVAELETLPPESEPVEVDDSLAQFLTPTKRDAEFADAHAEGDDAEKHATPPSTELAVTQHALVKKAPDWSSAAAAREYLEQMANVSPGAFARFWAARRGDIYLAIAVILVACVIRWGIWSDHSVTATGNPTATGVHRRPAPDADLSFFDRMLINLGLAEAPEPVEYKGNPDTQVWVDLQTALYYCPGADLYGKTPKGKYSSQRDAQLDSFEPALRKACN
jgi:putative methionine-R-sulfoxide reductase with GAF domain